MTAKKKNMVDLVLTLILVGLIVVVFPIIGLVLTFGYGEEGGAFFFLPLIGGMFLMSFFHKNEDGTSPPGEYF